jgi:hypothetical protein
MNEQFRLDLISYIKEHFISQSGRLITSRIKDEYREDIIKLSNKLIGNDITLAERVYSLVYDCNNICKVCNINRVEFISYKRGYRDYCSKKCAANSPIKKAKIRETCLEKYGSITNLKPKKGSDNPFSKNNIRLKAKSSYIKKIQEILKESYSLLSKPSSSYKFKLITHNSQLYSNKLLVANSKLSRYGSKVYNNRDKAKKTCFKKYGVSNVQQNPNIRKKTEDTNINRYGHKTNLVPMANKIANTNIERYGTKYPSQSQIIKDKLKAKWTQKYRHNHPNREHIKHYNELIDYDSFLDIYNRSKTIYDIAKYFNISSDHVYKYLQNYRLALKPRRKNVLQNEVISFIKSLDIENIVINSRSIIKPYELDILLPDYNLAIEFNGLLYHSYGISKYTIFNNIDKLDRNYHLNKTIMCENIGINLLHIYEDDWINSRFIWQSLIKSKLNLLPRTIYARKTTIKEIEDFSVVSQFLNDNHLQGSVNSSINYGLYYGDELVSIMTFIKSRFNKKYDYELLRFCSKNDIKVIGAGSKLLAQFKRDYRDKSIISYGNRSFVYSRHNLYNSLKFTYIGTSKPNYDYIDKDLIRHNRIEFQKHKLKDKLKDYKQDQSELENMIRHGYRVIYDCGNLIYKM